MNGDRLALENADVEFRGIVDQAIFPLRRNDVGQRLVMLVGVGEACDQRNRREFKLFDLLLHRPCMIDNRMGAEIEAPFLRFRTGRGCHHRQAGKAARELDQDRADTAGAADDQQRACIEALAGHRAEAIEQQFPGGDRRQRQRRGLRE